ncbi:hypothetical protein EB083_03505 [bacterium]|nr:hypothetical protein [bacterium]
MISCFSSIVTRTSTHFDASTLSSVIRALNRVPSRETHCGSKRFIHRNSAKPTAKNNTVEMRFNNVLAISD